MEYKLDQPIYGNIGEKKYSCTLSWRDGTFIVDESEEHGGKQEGPDPYSLLLSSIASGTLITLRKYIDKKGWDIPEIEIKVNSYRDKESKNTTVIDLDLAFPQPVKDQQKLALQGIAEQSPVINMLQYPIQFRTFVMRDKQTKVINYGNEEITVEWLPELCQHSSRCWKQLPEVFDPEVRKWIDVDGAPAKDIIEQVGKCPSGALRIKKKTTQENH